MEEQDIIYYEKLTSAVSHFLFETPLYKKVTDTDEIDLLKEGLSKHLNNDSLFLDGFNPQMKCESTFEIITGLASIGNSTYNYNFFKNSNSNIIRLRCRRYGNLIFFAVYWDSSQKTLTKIGQYPSIADFHIGEINKYSKILNKEKLKELTRGIGLAANGVGIGSFVYLRRVFEGLIWETYEKAKDNIDEEVFRKARMDEKIGLLDNFLPTFLVDNKNIYSILSIGIHELTENECLSYFDVLRNSIELILDEQIEFLQKQKKGQIAKLALANIRKRIKTNK